MDCVRFCGTCATFRAFHSFRFAWEFGDELDVFTAFLVCDDFFQLKRSIDEFAFC